MTQDEEHLNLLALFHYIFAGMTALFACLPVIHLVFGIAIMTGAFDGKEPPPAFMGLIFVIIGSALILLGWTMAVLILIAGRRLKQRRWPTFCLVIAALECLAMPLGTVLGIFTILVLQRDSVKTLFQPPAKAVA